MLAPNARASPPPRIARPKPPPKPETKSGRPSTGKAHPTNRNERKNETKSRRIEKQSQKQKQIKNKNGPNRNAKKEAPIEPRRSAAPFSLNPRPAQALRQPQNSAATDAPGPSKAKAKPAPGQQDRRPGGKKRKRPWIRPRTPTRPETAQGCGARKLCAAIQIAILTCAGRNCFARAAFAPLRRPIATCFERAFGVEAGARTGPSEASARRARRPNPLGGRRRQGLGARPKVGMNFA